MIIGCFADVLFGSTNNLTLPFYPRKRGSMRVPGSTCMDLIAESRLQLAISNGFLMCNISPTHQYNQSNLIAGKQSLLQHTHGV